MIYISINKSIIVRIYAFLHAWRLSGSPVKLVQNVFFEHSNPVKDKAAS